MRILIYILLALIVVFLLKIARNEQTKKNSYNKTNIWSILISLIISSVSFIIISSLIGRTDSFLGPGLFIVLFCLILFFIFIFLIDKVIKNNSSK